MSRLFGTDGVRGTANTTLTPELAYKLGRAATFLFGREHSRPTILIGRDTRISGTMLEAALAAGICSAGGEAILAGVVPTPAVAYLTRKLSAQAGVVISASHNPYPDNGIKFFAGTGYKLPDEVEDRLEELVLAPDDNLPRPTGNRVGAITHRHDLLDEYLDFLASIVTTDFTGIKVVVDCSHGAAYEAAPKILTRLGATVVVLNDQPTGVNINDNCGSTHLAGLQQAVVNHGAGLGIAHDGDADRCLAVDERGEIIDGDQIMTLCALNLMNQGKLKDNTLVTTVMSNIGLHKAMEQAGCKVLVTPVGDRYVLEAMAKEGYSLGGEQSGHIIFLDYNTTGDGILTALELIAALKVSGKKLSQLGSLMTRYPQLLVNVRLQSKDGWDTNPSITAAIAAGEQELGSNGRILVRPSGTEPLIRVMAEGPSEDDLQRIVEGIVGVIKAELS